jgi:O-antigen/teichoic acid export membrane protein
MISKKFLKSSFTYTFVGALPLASQIFLLPVISKYLSLSDFGYLALYTSITAFMQIIMTFGFDTTITTFYYEYYKDHKRLSVFLSTVFISLLAIGLGSIVFFLIAGPFVFDLFKDEGFRFFPYGLMSIFIAFFNSFFRVYTVLLINEQKPERFFWLNIINFGLTIVVTATGLYFFPFQLAGPMMGRLLPSLISFLTAAFVIFTAYGYQLDRGIAKQYIAFNVYLLGGALANWLVYYADRFIIKIFMTSREVGIYHFALQCASIIDIVIGALLNAVNPTIFKIWSNKKEYSAMEVNRYHNSLTAVTILLIALTIFFVPILTPVFISNKQFYAALPYIPIICLSVLPRVLGNMYIAVIYFEKRTKMLPQFIIVSGVAQLGIGVVLINFFKLDGASWMTFVTKIIYDAYLIYSTRNLFSLQYNKLKILVLPLIYITLVVISSQFLPYSYSNLFHFLELVITSAIILFIYKKEIIMLLKTYLKPKIAKPE